jgi:hypothetical protein
VFNALTPNTAAAAHPMIRTRMTAMIAGSFDFFSFGFGCGTLLTKDGCSWFWFGSTGLGIPTALVLFKGALQTLQKSSSASIGLPHFLQNIQKPPIKVVLFADDLLACR